MVDKESMFLPLNKIFLRIKKLPKGNALLFAAIAAQNHSLIIRAFKSFGNEWFDYILLSAF
ncbi:MAG: hypothetical protein C0448_06905 [Sphingobacteriaceae bacterium]|nr:hypothetical protein [Sphingobacteriaceae bacterium]